MTQEKQTKRVQPWYRFGEPVETLAISVPCSLKGVIREEARDLSVSASSIVTGVLWRYWRKKIRQKKNGEG